ncbi:uncharacterized protein A4U43_C07F28510 [Asparagus officinalis]|uniref:Nodulin-like domain-containing protein n=1 Tax=Asparagus officinalis TaxID=4686 RepID=A0A5P1EJ86_ASPOF|nr:uncharacterized protein A4U43_C07F28510 [Asparagus officinalis]
MEVVPVRSEEEKEKNTKPFFCFLYISLALATYLMVMIIVEKVVNFSQVEYIASACVIIFLLFLPLGVVIKDELRIRKLEEGFLKNPPPDDGGLSRNGGGRLQPAANARAAASNAPGKSQSSTGAMSALERSDPQPEARTLDSPRRFGDHRT